MKCYAISDIHGCAKTFQTLLKKLRFSKQDELYLLGDLIDRGPDSKGVLDHIFYLKENGYTVHCLRGNHEQMFLNSFTPSSEAISWLYHGGDATLNSFGVLYPKDIPRKYIDFIDNLPHYLEVNDYLLVHAGLNFDLPNPLDGLHSLLWIRNWYNTINYDWLGDRIVVHGHTPQKLEKIYEFSLRMHQSNELDKLPVICIDAGCPFDVAGYGHLCAFDLEEQRFYFQKNVDR